MTSLMRGALALAAACALTASSTHGLAGQRTPRPAMTLTVYAAASLTDAFRELGRTLEASHPGLVVRFNFAGSQQLALQIAQGAPADVLASADPRWMSYASGRGLVDGQGTVFARNRLVTILPRANPARIGELPDLVRRGTRIVVAAEAVPAGKYTREMLARLGSAPGYPPEYARRVLGNVVSQEESVKAVVAKVQLGEADAGIVYRSDVTPAVAPYVRVLEIGERYNVIASYPIAVLKGAKHPEAARWFAELVASPTGQATLARHGFLPAAAAAAAVHP